MTVSWSLCQRLHAGAIDGSIPATLSRGLRHIQWEETDGRFTRIGGFGCIRIRSRRGTMLLPA
jgi:hypothetical protein